MKWIIVYQRNVDGALMELEGHDMQQFHSAKRILEGRFEFDAELI